jgi:CheY-like chemotaxis protein
LAASAAEAVAVLGQEEFELVVTDMRMETPIAGYDVVRSALAQSYNPVVVILTAYPLQAAEWKREGAHAMFMKGDSPLTLLSEIRSLTRNAPLERGRKAAAGEYPRRARGTGT